MTEHHVVVGASAAGVAAALAMREAGFAGTVTVIDADARLPYERPPLSKSPGGTPVPILPAGLYAEKDIVLRLGEEVVGLDPDRRVVTLGTGEELPATRVLLATGAVPRRLGIIGEDHPRIGALRTAKDARRTFGQLSEQGPLVVVGGGFIGLEVAAVARGLGVEVTIVEAGPRPLLGPLGERVAGLVEQLHRENGVRILGSTTVERFETHGDGDGTVQVVLSTGDVLAAGAVVVGAGVTPNDGLAAAIGLTTDGGIWVDPHGRTSDPWVWAAGDVASHSSADHMVRDRFEHWEFAWNHGTAVGKSMAGTPTVNAEIPYFWSDQYDGTIQMYGRARPSDRLVLRRGASHRSFLAFWLRDGRLAAAAAYADPRSIRSVRALVAARAAVPAEALADPSTDWRKVAREWTNAAALASTSDPTSV